ncbi:MAG: hypothetical protein M1814_000509 [Vezdaea aestivalis]|nr:MAG: hypothetical protein M1814_000509 [Vezdaea aestivalis]
MSVARRKPILASQRLARTPCRPTRRFASTEHGSHQAEPVSESFGKGLYFALASVPATYFLYQAAISGDGFAAFTNLMSKYTESQITNEERNSLHTSMIERAAYDKNLFQTEGSRTTRHVDLKFPEVFNTGSPFNVPAGHGRANMDNLIEHYEKERQESEERLRQRRSKGESDK